ncbi:DUF2300 domain-containing protein [Leeia sp.]|uniref:DUF2300 domain-containing protein n=1 Tax=Leeia sp. TaxID=2884678 RepID=UPI0035B26F5A
MGVYRTVISLLLGGVLWQPAVALQMAWQRKGQQTLWQLGGNQPQSAPLPPGLQTPLGSVWKLFVYGYMVEQNLAGSDYVCQGGNPEEVYCCQPGHSVDRERALLQSCGLYFEPRRLKIAAADWRRFWQARQAPGWLQDLPQLKPERQVAVSQLLQGLAQFPPQARQQAGHTLVSVLTQGKAEGSVALLGSQLRVKTWTMPDPAHPGERQGGAAGWLADGSPVWLQGRGGSALVLPQLAPKLVPLLQPVTVADTEACVRVRYFARYPIQSVTRSDGRAVVPGVMEGQYQVHFRNGVSLALSSQGELWLQQTVAGWQVNGRLGLNEYVARVLEREGRSEPPEAARALAIAARSYVVQQGAREQGCFSMQDSSSQQRVAPRPASKAARAIVDWTDGLVLTGVPVQYHSTRQARHQLAWTWAVSAAQRGMTFDRMLQQTYPGSSLVSYLSPLDGDCDRLPQVERWLELQLPVWQRRLQREEGLEALAQAPAVCRLPGGKPYADVERGRIHVRGLATDEDRITVAHETLHLLFRHHPRGQDEDFVEQTARRLIQQGG